MGLVAMGKRKLSEIIHLRSRGENISSVAWKLDLAPWHVTYVTRFVKLCVSREEYAWMSDEAERWGFGTVGEFIMDVVNRLYDEHYEKTVKGKAKRKSIKAA